MARIGRPRSMAVIMLAAARLAERAMHHHAHLAYISIIVERR